MYSSEENVISPIHTERKRSINSDDHSPKVFYFYLDYILSFINI